MASEDVVIIELQGYQYRTSDFIVKELAITSGFRGREVTYLFQPPLEDCGIPSDILRGYDTMLHRISWNSGYTPYSELSSILRNATVGQTRVYTKGTEKARILQSYVSVPVVNLEDLHCPALHKLKCGIGSRARCMFHNSTLADCALQNARVLQTWFKSYVYYKTLINATDNYV